MAESHTAKATVDVDATREQVWHALVTPEVIAQYMFGSQLTSDWREDSGITWKGEWKGKTYEDKGEILRVVPEKLLQYTHFSPISGAPDSPENYHTVTIELADVGDRTRISLTQDGNATEEARKHSETNWSAMLTRLKKVVE